MKFIVLKKIQKNNNQTLAPPRKFWLNYSPFLVSTFTETFAENKKKAESGMKKKKKIGIFALQ